MQASTPLTLVEPVLLRIFLYGLFESVHNRQSGGIDARTLSRTAFSNENRLPPGSK